jgi:parallel beta-helix repeat protein
VPFAERGPLSCAHWRIVVSATSLRSVAAKWGDPLFSANAIQPRASLGTFVCPVTGGPQNIVLSDNEISYNDTCNWEAFSKFPVRTPAGCAGAGQFDGCGCSGGGKFWQAQNVTVRDNYVHDNYGQGIWSDGNVRTALYEGNRIENNGGAGIDHEISWDAIIRNNNLKNNMTLENGQGKSCWWGSAVALNNSLAR